MGHALLGSILSVLLPVVAMSVTQTPATSEATPVEAQRPENAPVDTYQVWIWPGAKGSRRHVAMTPRFAEMQTAAGSVSIECDIQSEIELGASHAVLEVEDSNGERVHRGGVDFDVTKGGNTCRFTWDASAIPDGAYRLDIVLYDNIHRDMAWADLDMSKYSSMGTQGHLDNAQAAVESLRGNLEGTPEDELGYKARLAIAADYLARAETADRGNWEYANRVASHALRTADSIRARLTFDGHGGGPNEPGPASGTGVTIRGGGLFLGDRPAFLAGLRAWPGMRDVVGLAARYGLDLVVLDTLQDPDPASPALLDAPLMAAKSANLHTLVVMNPGTPNPDAADAQPRSLATRDAIRAHAAYLAGRPGVIGMAIAEDPRFTSPGVDIEHAFREYAKETYGDRHVLNRAWMTRFMNFDEIRIAPGYDQGAYQADWQRFQRERLSGELMALRDDAAAAGPGLPLLILHGGNTLARGESRGGVDQPALARAFPLGGIDAMASPRHPTYALNYPMPSIVYALRRSIAPEVPLINVEPIAPPDPIPAGPEMRGYMRTLLWDGAIEGVSGFVFPAPGPGHADTLDDPGAMDGFVAAHAELNRHAGILRAFQQAPAEIGILWSEASKILKDGDPFLGSVMRAYEGTSFMGLKVGFITEDRCEADTLSKLKMLILASMPALDSRAFAEFDSYVTGGGLVIRAGTPIPYDENGQSRETVAAVSRDTLLVRGSDEPKEYLSMVDAAIARKDLPTPTRLVTTYGYPLEGVKSRYVVYEGAGYLYVINFRKQGVRAHITDGFVSGHEMIGNRPVDFPMEIPPMDPMLIRLDAVAPAETVEPLDEKEPVDETEIGPDGIPTGRVKPIEGN